MSAIDLFGCNPISMAGIKRLKIATRDTSEAPLDFPLDIVLKTNDESIIVLSDDEDNRIITLGTQQIKYRIVYPIHSSCTETETTDARGRYFNQILQWEMPQLNLTTINQLKAFLFTNSGEFAISNMVAIIEDMNSVIWIVGYTQPLVLDTFELTTGTSEGDNRYSLSYTCRSYSKIRQVELI